MLKIILFPVLIQKECPVEPRSTWTTERERESDDQRTTILLGGGSSGVLICQRQCGAEAGSGAVATAAPYHSFKLVLRARACCCAVATTGRQQYTQTRARRGVGSDTNRNLPAGIAQGPFSQYPSCTRLLQGYSTLIEADNSLQ